MSLSLKDFTANSFDHNEVLELLYKYGTVVIPNWLSDQEVSALNGDLEGTLCGNCIRGCQKKPSAINEKLFIK